MNLRHLRPLLVLPFAAVLGGCEIPGMEDTTKIAEAKEADGKAIGGACRHSGRALEDCYVMNPKALKAAIYAGWRDMDAYMRDNKIEPVMPDLVDAPGGAKAPEAAEKRPADDKKAAAKHSSAEQPAAARPRRVG